MLRRPLLRRGPGRCSGKRLRTPTRIETIAVAGNQRIEAATVRSYITVREGDAFDPTRIDRSLKNLFATGLFADVSIGTPGQHRC